MSARGFRSITMVAGVAAAALSCYMVSLRVASERAALEEVENEIVLAQRDIRVLQTEIGTRGRLAQLESWNVKVLALSAPAANQFVEGGFALASLVAPKKAIDPAAPVVLASAPTPDREPRLASDGAQAGVAAKDLMQVASLKRDLPSQDDQPQPTARVPASKARGSVAAVVKKTVEKAGSAKAGEATRTAKPAKQVKDSATAKAEVKSAATKPVTSRPVPTKSAPVKSAAATPAQAKPAVVKTPAAKATKAPVKTSTSASSIKEAKAKQ